MQYSYFLEFRAIVVKQSCILQERDDIVAELLECNLPNKLESDNLGHVMQLWREGMMTNWDYLTQLNKVSIYCS